MILLEELIVLRRELHRYPERSGREAETARRIEQALGLTDPDEIITGLGGHGVAAVYRRSGKTGSGPARMFRAELDALPIAEQLNVPYVSDRNDTSHKCGHDGHMAALVGLAHQISKQKSDLPCDTVLLFQPSEENAKGAEAVLADPRFQALDVGQVLAWHNLPGYDLGELLVRKGVFASASRGLTVHLSGVNSHAAHTEDGCSPLPVLTHLLSELPRLPQACVPFDQAARVTVVGARLGSSAFGTSPGSARVMATFRTHREQDMREMAVHAERMVRAMSAAHGITAELSWADIFRATTNDPDMVGGLIRIADQLDMGYREMTGPFPWSEDFGLFTEQMPGMLFGIGSGVSCPQLHHPDYDFPDELLGYVLPLLVALAFDTELTSGLA